MAKFVTGAEAVSRIQDGMTVGVGGFACSGAAETVLRALRKSYAETNSPGNLDIISPIAPGDPRDRENIWGLSALGAEGLIASVTSAMINKPLSIADAVNHNKIACYLVPLGIFGQLFRAMAGRKPGMITHVGLNTFADPRIEGCKCNQLARDSGREIVSLLSIDGKDTMFYRSFHMDVCILRGTYADEDGNISVEHEAIVSELFEMAAAVHNGGGIVIVEVEKIVRRGSIHSRQVKLHNTMVDYVVISEPGLHPQGYITPAFRPELVGDMQVPVAAVAPLEFGLRKIVARRAAMEIKTRSFINLGMGISDGVSIVANEEGLTGDITLGIETGVMGGVPLKGLEMGMSINTEAIYGMADTFDIYDGGMLDMTFLSFAQVDRYGNVNVSKFDGRLNGPGGFVNISQNTPKICFSAIFTIDQPQCEIEDGVLHISRDGEKLKFVNEVEQITFSGKNALESGQDVIYVTERAVFKLTPEGLMLTELAPGVDLEKEVLAKMEFQPLIAPDLKTMDTRIFRPEKMGLCLSPTS